MKFSSDAKQADKLEATGGPLALIQEMKSLSESAADPGTFFVGLLSRIVASLKAVGGAVWLLDEQGRPAMQCHQRLPEAMPGGSENLAQHAALIQRALTGDPLKPIQPHKGLEGEGNVGNPSDYVLLFGQLKAEEAVLGGIEVFLRVGGTAPEERNSQKLLQHACNMAASFLAARQLRNFFEHKALWSKLNEYTESIHLGLNSRTIAFTLANEGRRLMECDRVSVALWNGRQCRIEAISGQDVFDKRANQVRLLNKLATMVVRSGDTLWFTGNAENVPPQIEAALQEYVDESHSNLVAVVPLAKPSLPATADDQPAKPVFVGALIVEMTHGVGELGMRERATVVGRHGAAALANAVEHESMFLLPVWRTIGKSRWLVQARTLPKTITAVCVLALAIGSLFLIQTDFNIESKGTLEPVAKRDVFAPQDGVVQAVKVEHGQTVAEGTPLVVMTNTDASVTLTDLKGKLASTNEQLRSIDQQRAQLHLTQEDRDKLSSQAVQLHATRRSLDRQVALLIEKQRQLEVASPIAGQIVTWKLRDKLINRPVQRGQTLLTVADTNSDWQLELHLPEDRMGYVAKAQQELADGERLPVHYILATNPSGGRDGSVQEIHTTAEVRGEEGNTILVKIQINKDDLAAGELHPGAGVTAKIHCGRASLGYCWFHDVINFFIRMWFKL